MLEAFVFVFVWSPYIPNKQKEFSHLDLSHQATIGASRNKEHMFVQVRD